jgi:hypothetical protein
VGLALGPGDVASAIEQARFEFGPVEFVELPTQDGPKRE